MIEQVATFFTLNFFLELFGFVLNLLYLYYIIQQKSVAWLWSIFACAVFVWLCYDAQLYLQTALYIFYIIIAIYGLMRWKFGATKAIVRMTTQHHWRFVSSCLILGLFMGYLFDNQTDQSMPYLDGLITAFAVGTTLLIVSKHRENWLYWILINLASVFLYYTQGLYFLAAMSFILMLFAVRGYQVWNRAEAQDQ